MEENKKLNFIEFESKNLSLKSYPQKVFVEISRNCNLKCTMCQNRKQKYSKNYNMKFELFKRVADKLFSNAQSVDLRGFGESIIHPQFEDFVEYALKYSCDFGLVTNLSLKKDSLWEKLVKNNFWLGISIDGATKKTFENIRKGSKFETIIHNLELIKKEKKKNNTDPWRIYFIVTLQKNNIEDLEDIIKMAKQFGITRVEINPVQLPFFDYNKLSFHKNKVKENIKKAEIFAAKNNITILFDGKVLKNQKQDEKTKIKTIARCKNPWTNLYVSYDGRIGPCNHLMSKPVVLGDLKKGSFRNEWNNKEFQNFRKYNDTNKRYRACNWCYKNRFDHF